MNLVLNSNQSLQTYLKLIDFDIITVTENTDILL